METVLVHLDCYTKMHRLAVINNRNQVLTVSEPRKSKITTLA